MSGKNGSIKPGAGSWSYDPFQISVGYRLDFNMLTPHADPTQTRLPTTTPCYQSEIAFLILKFKRVGKLWKRAAQFLILQESLDYLLTNKKGLKLILYKLEGLAKGIYLSRSLLHLLSLSLFYFFLNGFHLPSSASSLFVLQLERLGFSSRSSNLGIQHWRFILEASTLSCLWFSYIPLF